MVITLIKFTKHTDIEVKTPRGIIENDIFVEGEEVEVYRVSRGENSTDWTFGDGSVAYGVPNDCFEIVG